MSTTKEIKRRIKSVKNTKKITKAMELVAASKMKRAVDSTLASREYATYAQQILESVQTARTAGEEVHPILRERPVKNVLIVLITSNRGLCGAYNSHITKKVIESIKLHDDDHNLSFVAVGKKGEDALRRMNQNIVASFSDLPENISLRDSNSIASYIVEEYKKESYDKVLVAYTDYISALTQEPHIRQLLPLSKEDLEKVQASEGGEMSDKPLDSARDGSDFIFEPDYDKLMKILVWKLTQMQVYQMLLESRASEQSARMMAMKNASESAGEMIDNLTLVFNKARQAGITQEISEISAGSVALE